METPLCIETLPNTPSPCPTSPTSSPPPEERSGDSLEDRDSRRPQSANFGPTGQSVFGVREVKREICEDKLRKLNCHLEMNHLTPGDLVPDKVTSKL